MGQSTLVVSLPHDWVKRFNLRPSDKIDLFFEGDGSIRIFPETLNAAHTTRAPCVIKAAQTNGDETVLRLLVAAYAMGYESIIVNKPNEVAIEDVRRGINLLTGLTVVEQDAERMVLQSFVDAKKFRMPTIFHRMQIINDGLSDIFVKMLDGGHEEAVEVEHLAVESDRLYFLALRQILTAQSQPGLLQEIGVDLPQHLIGSRLISMFLEEAADILEEMVDHAGKLLQIPQSDSGKLFSTLLDRHRAIWKLFRESIDSFQHTSFSVANSVLNSIKKAEGELDNDINRLTKFQVSVPFAIHYHALLRAMQRTVSLADAIGKITVNRSVSAPITQDNGRYVGL